MLDMNQIFFSSSVGYKMVENIALRRAIDNVKFFSFVYMNIEASLYLKKKFFPTFRENVQTN